MWGDYDRDDPFPLFARVRTEGPVHEVTLPDGQRAWLVVRYGEARAALSDPRLSKDMHAALARDGAVVAEGLPGPAFARHMLSVDPPITPGLRRLAAAAFGRPRIAALRPRIQALVDGLLDELESRGDVVVDLVAGFAFPLPFTVISELLGVPEPDRAQLGAWFTTLLAPASAPEPPPSAVAASAEVVRYLTELLDRKRVEPGPDLVTDLVRAGAKRDALSRQEMLSTIFQLMVAGHDTTTSLIGNGTVALLTHPDQRAALAADPGLLPRAIEEMLRWDAPVPHSTFRYTTQEVQLGGTVDPRLRAGDHLAGGRQPRPGPLPGRRVLRHHPHRQQPPRLRARHPPLPRRPAGPPRGPDRLHCPAGPIPRDAARRPALGAALGPRRRPRAARPGRTPRHPRARTTHGVHHGSLASRAGLAGVTSEPASPAERSTTKAHRRQHDDHRRADDEPP